MEIGLRVTAVNLPKSLADFPQAKLSDLQSALKNADIIVLLVDHRQFKRIDRDLLNMKFVIDTRGIWR